jgi:hypothetical protein
VSYQLDLTEAKRYELRGRTLWIDLGDHESVIRVPKGARCTLWKRARRHTVNVGGLNSITCTISGRPEQIAPLWKELRE